MPDQRRARTRWGSGAKLVSEGVMAGGALGAATGPAAPIAVPVGVTVGTVAGQHLAEEFYDDHIEATKAWMKARNEDVSRRILNEFQIYTRPAWARERF